MFQRLEFLSCATGGEYKGSCTRYGEVQSGKSVLTRMKSPKYNWNELVHIYPKVLQVLWNHQDFFPSPVTSKTHCKVILSCRARPQEKEKAKVFLSFYIATEIRLWRNIEGRKEEFFVKHYITYKTQLEWWHASKTDKIVTVFHWKFKTKYIRFLSKMQNKHIIRTSQFWEMTILKASTKF